MWKMAIRWLHFLVHSIIVLNLNGLTVKESVKPHDVLVRLGAAIQAKVTITTLP